MHRTCTIYHLKRGLSSECMCDCEIETIECYTVWHVEIHLLTLTFVLMTHLKVFECIQVHVNCSNVLRTQKMGRAYLSEKYPKRRKIRTRSHLFDSDNYGRATMTAKCRWTRRVRQSDKNISLDNHHKVWITTFCDSEVRLAVGCWQQIRHDNNFALIMNSHCFPFSNWHTQRHTSTDPSVASTKIAVQLR